MQDGAHRLGCIVKEQHYSLNRSASTNSNMTNQTETSLTENLPDSSAAAAALQQSDPRLLPLMPFQQLSHACLQKRKRNCLL